MLISDWSSVVCSSDLLARGHPHELVDKIGQRILGAALRRLVEIFLHRATIFGKRRLHRGDPQQVLGLKVVEHERMGHVRAFGDGTRRRPLETKSAEAFECGGEDPLAHLLPPLGLAFPPARHGGPLTGMAFPDQPHCRTAPARRHRSRLPSRLSLYPLPPCRHTPCLSTVRPHETPHTTHNA